MSEGPKEGRAQPWKIALVSASVLVLELALIRQVPAEVRIISYFTNLILMSSFFGLGLGMILQGGRRFDLLLPLGLLAVAGFVFWARGLVIFDHATEVHYWLLYEAPEGTATKIPALPAAIMAFVFCATPFVALGSLLAHEMDKFPRLVAYGWDIAGSLGGTLLFVVSSALLLLLEDAYTEDAVDSLSGYNAQVVTLTVGDELSGEIAQFAAGAVADDEGNVIAGVGGAAADDEGDVVAGAEVAVATGD